MLLHNPQDPCISIGEPNGTYAPYDSVRGRDVWINKADGVTPVKGRVWPEDPVYFPDYTNPVTQEWWTNQIVEFKKILDFDSLWVDMNEPANFVQGDEDDGCARNQWNNPPYIPSKFTHFEF